MVKFTSFMNDILDDKDRVKCLLKFNDNEAFTSLSFLKKKEIICNMMDEMSEEDKEYHLKSIDLVLEECNKKTYNVLRKQYNDYKESEPEIEDNNDDNDIVPTGELNWDNVMKVYLYYRNQVNKFKDKDTISGRDYTILFRYLLLGLVCVEPIRKMSGYLLMKVVHKYKSNLSSKFNYYCLKTKQFYFLDNHNVSKEPVTDTMQSILDIYLKFHPLYKQNNANNDMAVKLFIHHDGSCVSTDSHLTKTYQSIFINFGSKISISKLKKLQRGESKVSSNSDIYDTIMLSSMIGTYTLGSINEKKKSVFILCNTNTNVINITLTHNHDKIITIKDTSGDAGTNNIYIKGYNIDGRDSVVIDNNYGCIVLYSFHDKWFITSKY